MAFALWHKKGAKKRYRTKNEIARVLLGRVIRKGIRPEYITFDSWYASRENMILIKRLGLQFVTRLKKNQKLSFEGRKLQAKKIGKLVLEKASLISFGTWMCGHKVLRCK